MSKKKSKSVVPIAKLKNALRRVHMHCKYRQKAKARAKIDSALFKCEGIDCKIAIYEGSSEKNYMKLVEAYSDSLEVVRGKVELDHEKQVIEPVRGFCDWNTYIERLWCDDNGYNVYCNSCHAEKTARESKERAEHGTLKRNKDV